MVEQRQRDRLGTIEGRRSRGVAPQRKLGIPETAKCAHLDASVLYLHGDVQRRVGTRQRQGIIALP